MIPGLGRSPGGGHGNPLLPGVFLPGESHEQRSWRATVDGVAESRNTTEQLTVPHFHSGSPGKKLGSQVSWGQVMLPLGCEARHHQRFFLLFSVGPLHSDLEYTVSSQKEGYVLTAVEGTIGDFKAYALAGVSFEVTPCAFKKQFYGV